MRLKKIHIGHHFFGSGNIGDDFVLAGFLEETNLTQTSITCCVPYELEILKQKFPQVQWYPYTEFNRKEAINSCDVWLGLGGSIYQNSVSNWFIDHLKQESMWCSCAKKPMFFLGVGGQDHLAFRDKELINISHQAEHIWTRDHITYNKLLSNNLDNNKIDLGADLSHIYFEKITPNKATKGLIAVCINFDYQERGFFDCLLESYEQLPSKKRHWIIQESRPLPGAEQSIYAQLDPLHKAKWCPIKWQNGETDLSSIIDKWNSPEWLLTSRYHTAIASAWAGSKTIVINTNLKLQGIAEICKFKLVDTNLDFKTLKEVVPTKKSNLLNQVHLAKKSVASFFSMI